VSRVKEIADQLRNFSSAELREIRDWLDEYENQAWDRQFESEVASGKWDERAVKALSEHKKGRSTPL
jgi:hypothetical protein